MLVTVIRPFCIAGKRLDRGSIVEVADQLGRELMGSNKASQCEAVKAEAKIDELVKKKEKK